MGQACTNVVDTAAANNQLSSFNSAIQVSQLFLKYSHIMLHAAYAAFLPAQALVLLACAYLLIRDPVQPSEACIYQAESIICVRLHK